MLTHRDVKVDLSSRIAWLRRFAENSNDSQTEVS